MSLYKNYENKNLRIMLEIYFPPDWSVIACEDWMIERFPTLYFFERKAMKRPWIAVVREETPRKCQVVNPNSEVPKQAYPKGRWT